MLAGQLQPTCLYEHLCTASAGHKCMLCCQVWLDDELMKTYAGRFSPGPCTYQTPGALGKQVRFAAT